MENSTIQNNDQLFASTNQNTNSNSAAAAAAAAAATAAATTTTTRSNTAYNKINNNLTADEIRRLNERRRQHQLRRKQRRTTTTTTSSNNNDYDNRPRLNLDAIRIVALPDQVRAHDSLEETLGVVSGATATATVAGTVDMFDFVGLSQDPVLQQHEQEPHQQQPQQPPQEDQNLTYENTLQQPIPQQQQQQQQQQQSPSEQRHQQIQEEQVQGSQQNCTTVEEKEEEENPNQHQEQQQRQQQQQQQQLLSKSSSSSPQPPSTTTTTTRGDLPHTTSSTTTDDTPIIISKHMILKPNGGQKEVITCTALEESNHTNDNNHDQNQNQNQNNNKDGDDVSVTDNKGTSVGSKTRKNNRENMHGGGHHQKEVLEEENWHAFLRTLQTCKRNMVRHDDDKIPSSTSTTTSVSSSLQKWVHIVRKLYKQKELPMEKIRALESIGFIWDPTVSTKDLFSLLSSPIVACRNNNMEALKPEQRKQNCSVHQHQNQNQQIPPVNTEPFSNAGEGSSALAVSLCNTNDASLKPPTSETSNFHMQSNVKKKSGTESNEMSKALIESNTRMPQLNYDHDISMECESSWSMEDENTFFDILEQEIDQTKEHDASLKPTTSEISKSHMQKEKKKKSGNDSIETTRVLVEKVTRVSQLNYAHDVSMECESSWSVDDENTFFDKLKQEIDQRKEREKLMKGPGNDFPNNTSQPGRSLGSKNKEITTVKSQSNATSRTVAESEQQHTAMLDDSGEQDDLLRTANNRRTSQKPTGSGSSPIELLDSSSDEENIAPQKLSTPVRASLFVPKYLNHRDPKKTTEKPFLDPDIFERNILTPFVIKTGSVEAKLLSVADDPWSWKLYVEGRKIHVQAFRRHLEKWIETRRKQQAVQDLLSDRGRIEFDVAVSRALFLKAWHSNAIEEISVNKTCLGLWLDFCTTPPYGQILLEPILGAKNIRSKQLVAAIVRIDGEEYHTKKHWRQVRERFSESYADSMNVTICVCLGDHGSMSEINDAKIDGKVRRFDGDASFPGEIEVATACSEMDMSSLTDRRKSPPLISADRKAFNEYVSFKAKFSDVYDIEYQRSDIGYQLAMSAMWRRHKRRYGTKCDDSCRCALDDMPFLVFDVVDIFISNKIKNDSTWKIPPQLQSERNSPVGFVNHFVQRFAPLVESSYPTENPVRIFERLKKMWGLHLRTKLFGSHCGEKCSCRDGWIQVFREGDVLGENTRKRPLPAAIEGLPRVPKKKHRISDSTDVVDNAPAAATLQGRARSLIELPVSRTATSDSISAKTPTRENLKTVSASPPNLKPVYTSKVFSVSLDTRKPLGFYCITDNSSSPSVCRIISVDCTGQAKKRGISIQNGTRVDAVEMNQGSIFQRYSISSHDMLMNYYTFAKEKSTEIKLTLNNSDVHYAIRDSVDSHEWTAEGKWLGKATGGWAGGAASGHRGQHRQPNIFAGREAKQCNILPTAEANSEGGAFSRREGWSSRSKVPPDGRRVDSREKAHGENTKSADGATTKTAAVDSAETSASHELLPPDSDFLWTLSAAIKENKIGKMLELLQHRPLRTDQLFDGRLFISEHYALAKKEKLDAVLPVLKVYKASERAIRKALEMETGFHIRVQFIKIHGVNLTPEGLRYPGSRSIKCRVFVDGRQRHSTPAIGIGGESDTVPIPDNEITFKQGDLSHMQFELHLASENRKHPPKINFSLADVYGSLYSREPLSITKTLHVVDPLFTPGMKIELKITRLPTEGEATDSNFAKDLKYSVDWIEQFNRQVGDGVPRLQANIQGPFNFSLLHAGVAAAEAELVERILHLGADPDASSIVGSALLYSARLAHEAQTTEKLEVRRAQKATTSNDDMEFDQDAKLRRDDWLCALGQLAKNLEKILQIISNHTKDNVRSSKPDDDRYDAGRATPGSGSKSAKTQAVSFIPHQSDMDTASDLQNFLVSIKSAPSYQTDGWLSMDMAFEIFFSIARSRKEAQGSSLFAKIRALATSNHFIEWLQPDEECHGEMIKIGNPLTLVDEAANGFCLRLTEAGDAFSSETLNIDCMQKFSLTDMEASVKNRTVEQGGNSTVTLLQCMASAIIAGSADEGWISMHQLSKAFFEKIVAEDNDKLDVSLSTATKEGLIEWGRPDEDCFGDMEVVSQSVFDDQEEASLRLTEKGHHFLANSNESTAPKGITNRDYPQVACDSMLSFLELLRKTKAHEDGWVSREDLATSFIQKFACQGTPKEVEFRKWCMDATQQELLIWGRCRGYNAFEACTHQNAEQERYAVLKLTEKGRNLVYATAAKITEASLQRNAVRNDDEAFLRGKLSANAALSTPATDAPILSRGRGAGRTLPAWMTRGHESRIIGVDEEKQTAGEQMSLVSSGVVPSWRTAQQMPACGRGASPSMPAWMTQQKSQVGVDAALIDPENKERARETMAAILSERNSSVGFRGSGGKRSHSQASDSTGDTSCERYLKRQRHGYQSFSKDDDTSNSHWFLPKASRQSKLCQRFRSACNVACRFGRHCHFAHVNPQLGGIVLGAYQGMVKELPRDCFLTKTRIAPGTVTLQYTAAYRDPTTKIYFAAEGGREVARQGSVSWYESELDAMKAVEIVVAAAKK